nr:unnamed protein product [Haemonchus contortus]
MPSKHLILLAGKHSLTKESIKPPVQDYTLLESSDDCRGKKRGCKVHYGDYIYSEKDERSSTLERIEGRLVIHKTTLTNLSKFEKITVVGLYGPAVEVTENHLLEDISSLFKMNIKGPEPVLHWEGNKGRWCRSKADLKLLSRITRQKPYKLAPGDNHAQLHVLRNKHLMDPYMENLVELHGVYIETCWNLPQHAKHMFESLTKDVTIVRAEREKCTLEQYKKDTERERIVGSRPSNLSEIGGPEFCFAGNDGQLTELLRTQSYARLISMNKTLTEEYGNLTICEHFYGHLKVHGNETRGEFAFIQQLKKITGCLDIVNVTNSTSLKTNSSYFEELDLTNLTEIDYDGALCGNFFA